MLSVRVCFLLTGWVSHPRLGVPLIYHYQKTQMTSNAYLICFLHIARTGISRLKAKKKKPAKIVIFGRGTNDRSFSFVGSQLDIVNNFKYLGVTFSKMNSFNWNIKELCEKATKAMYGVIGKCRIHNLPLDCKLDMFDKAITWLGGRGYCNTRLIEKLHLKFCKHILNLKASTSNLMVYGELRRYPLIIIVKVRMISIWGKITQFSV